MMMKSIVAICLSLSLTFLAGTPLYSQSGIRYDHSYTLVNDIKHCAVQLTITKKPKLLATLVVNKRRYSSYLFENRNNREKIYNFYVVVAGKKKLLMLQFRQKDADHCCTATIINQDYAAIFKPCPDEKYIKLESCH